MTGLLEWFEGNWLAVFNHYANWLVGLLKCASYAFGSLKLIPKLWRLVWQATMSIEAGTVFPEVGQSATQAGDRSPVSVTDWWDKSCDFSGSLHDINSIWNGPEYRQHSRIRSARKVAKPTSWFCGWVRHDSAQLPGVCFAESWILATPVTSYLRIITLSIFFCNFVHLFVWTLHFVVTVILVRWIKLFGIIKKKLRPSVWSPLSTRPMK